MDNIKFEGIYSATFSLYDENMNVLKGSVRKLIEYNLKGGVNGFYVGGNTGECTVLPNKTRKQMLETVKETVQISKMLEEMITNKENISNNLKDNNELDKDKQFVKKNN